MRSYKCLLAKKEGAILTHGVQEAVEVQGNSMPLIIAGGGGGGLRDKEHERCNANVGTTGNAGYTSWLGGSNGNGAYKTAYGYSGRGKV